MAKDGIVSFLDRRRWLRDRPEPRLLRALGWLGLRTILILALPLGFLWAHDSRVRPILTEIDAAQAAENRQLRGQRDALQAEMSQLRWERASIQATLDTLYLPAIRQRQALCDSLRAMREEQVRRPAVTQAQVDSLEAAHDQLVCQVADLQGGHWTRVSTLNNLDSWQRALRDSMICAEQRELARQTVAVVPPKRGITLRSVVTHIGYAVAPVLGYLWVHDS